MSITSGSSSDWREPFERNGFAVIESVITPQRARDLIQITADCVENSRDGVLRRGQEAYGVRDLLWRESAVRELADSMDVRALVEPILGSNAFPVRGLFFDKTPATNWNLPWHQDMTIAVRRRREVAGFGPWTVKAGIPHVVAPADLLSRMVTIRLHLDDCGNASGPMRVLPGSHRHGRLEPSAIHDWAARASAEAADCLVPAGGAVVMRPLILHASASGTGAAHRRVIHLEYAAEPLPDGLEWLEKLGDALPFV